MKRYPQQQKDVDGGNYFKLEVNEENPNNIMKEIVKICEGAASWNTNKNFRKYANHVNSDKDNLEIRKASIEKYFVYTVYSKKR